MRTLMLAVLLTTVACSSVAALAQASTARYPVAVRSAYLENCVATGTIAARKRYGARAHRLASKYCACSIARLEARMPLAAFTQYTLNLVTGRAQKPAHQRLIFDIATTCARSTLPA